MVLFKNLISIINIDAKNKIKYILFYVTKLIVTIMYQSFEIKIFTYSYIFFDILESVYIF